MITNKPKQKIWFWASSDKFGCLCLEHCIVIKFRMGYTSESIIMLMKALPMTSLSKELLKLCNVM